MAFDPRNWDPDMDIAVAVGLGTGNRMKLVAACREILQLQQAFMGRLGANSPVHLSNVVYTCHKMAEAAGLESPERFFGSEEDAKKAEAAMRSAPAAPSAEERKLELEKEKLRLEREKFELEKAETLERLRLDAWKAQTDAARDAAKTAQSALLDKAKTEGSLALKAAEMRMEEGLDRARLAAGERGSGLTNIKGVGGW